jgi:soluble cytochrome b562
MASFEGKDVTFGHPPENLTAETYAAYSRGHVENVRRQGDFLLGDLHIKDPQLRSEVENGLVREVSAGYTAEFVPDGTDGTDGTDWKQINIRGNHVAVVLKGRAGHDVAIKDTALGAEKGRKKMSKLTEAWLRLFSHAAKEVEGAELERLTADAAVVLDAEPEKPDKAAAHEQQEEGFKTQLDNLLARMDKLENALQKGEAEKEPKDGLSARRLLMRKSLLCPAVARGLWRRIPPWLFCALCGPLWRLLRTSRCRQPWQTLFCRPCRRTISRWARLWTRCRARRRPEPRRLNSLMRRFAKSSKAFMTGLIRIKNIKKRR